MKQTEVEFNKLEQSDLIVDATYKGGAFGDVRDDPLSKLLHCGNQGGFRIVGSAANPLLVVLFSTLNDPESSFFTSSFF